MQYKMNGLSEHNTQGWMAAVGCLYILDRMGLAVQMMWDDSHPVINGVNEEQVLDTLEEYLIRGSDILDNLPSGLGTEKAPLDLTAGRVNLVKVIDNMLSSVSREKITEALNSPWANTDNVTSLGWDIGSVKLAASVGGNNAPDSSPHRGVLAGQWLAAESLPITGIGSRKRIYSWVTWSVPLDMGGVRSVVQSLSTDWGGVRYEANIARNGQMGYLEPSRTSNTH
jgi:hypothetical protein